jgi:predicted GNAT superfamily acetyltransferase
MQAIVLRRFVLHFGSTSFVAWRDGERVGYVIGWFPQDEPDEVFVHSITMAPGERGRGTGRLLYARLAEAAKAKGKRRMAATIRPQNEGSLAFHRALGFSFRTAGAVADGRGVPVLVDWDGPGEDRVLAEAAIEDLRFG